MNKLVARVLAVRAMIKELEKSPGRLGSLTRQQIRDQSLFLEGLETAASLVLGSEDLRILMICKGEGE